MSTIRFVVRLGGDPLYGDGSAHNVGATYIARVGHDSAELRPIPPVAVMQQEGGTFAEFEITTDDYIRKAEDLKAFVATKRSAYQRSDGGMQWESEVLIVWKDFPDYAASLSLSTAGR